MESGHPEVSEGPAPSAGRERPRILIVITSLGSGGAEKQAILLANHLALRSDVEIASMQRNDFRIAELDQRVRITHLGFKLDGGSALDRVASVREAFKLCRSLRPNLIISFNFPAHALVWGLQSVGIPAPHMVSERNVELGSRARIQVRRIFYRLTACTVVNTEATKKALVSRGLEPRRGISIVHNAVALPSEELAVRSFEPPDNRPFEWITVGRLVAQKDYPSLLAALKLLGEQGVAVRLTIVGRGADEPMLKRLSVSLGVGDSVTWLGERSDVTELLPQYDGFVLASAWEGLPNALLEAAVVGLPAVVTDVGGSSEVFPEEQRSTLVPAGEPNRLATRMRQVVEQPAAVRNREARERQDYVRKNFSPPSVFTKWDAVINQELARRKVDL